MTLPGPADAGRSTLTGWGENQKEKAGKPGFLFSSFNYEKLCLKRLSAFGGTTGCANEASFLVGQVVGPAFGAAAFLYPGSVGNILAQCTFNPVFPGIDGIAVELQG